MWFLLGGGVMYFRKFNSSLRRLLERYASAPMQRLREKTFSAPFARGVGVLVLAAIGLSCELLLMFHARENEAENRVVTAAYASNLRARADRELNAVLFLSSGLSSYLVVRHDQLDSLELYRILANLYGSSRHIRNFSIAVGYRAKYVYPLRGNEKVLNIDYTKLPAQWPEVARAIASVRGTLTGPVDLVQGGSGLIYRVPVFVDDSYWGLLSTVINPDSFFASAFDELRSERYEFAIRGKDGLGTAGEVFYGDPAVFADSEAIQIESEVPNGKWIYAVRAKTLPGSSVFNWLLRLSGWLLAALTGLATTTLLLQRVELARHAGFDSLTGLPNRRLLDDRLEQAVQRHERETGGRIGVLFIDLDGFKAINDEHGHKAGDAALRTAAQRIREEIRLSDTVARWGGDEFVAVIEEANEALMQYLSHRLRHCIEQPFEYNGVTFRMSASIGTAMLSSATATAEALLQLADRHMFENKQQRRSAKAVR
ncbi:MAG: diguanylate cyclase [Proteobacteria bacterium]|nr:diguanylate cyclase [Pseudomonadota bacterium]